VHLIYIRIGLDAAQRANINHCLHLLSLQYAPSLDALPIPNNHSAPSHIQLQVAVFMAVCQWTLAAAISTVIAWFDFHWQLLCLTDAYRWSAVLFSAAATAPISHMVAADTSVSFCCCCLHSAADDDEYEAYLFYCCCFS
jgi:hypothetical protein